MAFESDGISWRVKLVLEESYQHYGGGSTVAYEEDDPGSEFNLVKRVFELSVQGDASIRVKQVVQYQYLSWPDHGTPEVDQFVRVFKVFHTARQRVLNREGAANAPILVHCSAGVGRTGCLIALERLVSEVFEQKRKAEEETPSVQTTGQYQLIYEAMALLVSSGFFNDSAGSAAADIEI
ncbi:protein-tyrosine phosphatase, putative [Perkinsus marinus ATCC 50983]|uniref:Protein-tyrosine phosphatase, putative n=1 Tax=Perkinsus marinus (strain ATCC 50983 / TXsc) TaxID=423536 RepID=C5L6L7_PERM5|nr:protein-tyrosine phosphatase, putative [Perkinsus marinus ATCC 50983]EER07678.1 protein-tyrosine phosphatase, putative [Perkinsus marinus ATCC 50983]|eukprot:XP_002775862.1 protein-tyrosine phosphatase, putative [Perkinsus marinus ATCC 50983]